MEMKALKELITKCDATQVKYQNYTNLSDFEQ